MKPCLLLFLTTLAWADDKPKEDIDKIQGAWTVSRMEINGKQQPKTLPVKVTFDGDKLLATVGKLKPESKGTIKLDPKQEPKWYEVKTPEGLTVLGIYELDGDTLKVCLSSPGDERPKTFETSQEDGRTFITYRREKPSKPK
jgi:uncharacterized protein (TIGR03067 family)